MEAFVALSEDDDDMFEDDEDQPVELDINGSTIRTDRWFKLVNEQPVVGLTAENFGERTTVGQVYAFVDKCLLDSPWRCVFVVRVETGVLLFDEDGCALDEPEYGTPDGLQSLVDFVDDWKHGYYAVGESVEAHPDPAAEEAEADEEVEAEANGVPSTFTAVGSRIKICIGVPAAWYGGLVCKDEEHANSILCAFDDGELRAISHKQLAKYVKDRTIAVPTDAEGGIVANEGNHLSAAALTFVAPGGRAKPRPAGVLLGPTTAKLGNDIIYQKHVVDPTAFAKVPALQEREGWHTFGKGDHVELIVTDGKGATEQASLKRGESAEACVFGVVDHQRDDSVAGDQPRKLLILYEL